MRIGILEAGTPPAHLAARHGSYAAMTRALLGSEHQVREYRAFEGVLPARVDDADAYIVTGSPAGVGDAQPWIAPLTDFLRHARGQAKLVGICFGHQVMAHAFGGVVHKAPQGWGLGIHRYEVADEAADFPSRGTIEVIVSHQDQVAAPPSDAMVVAGSHFTPNGVLAYTDGSAISCQCHPEFTPAFARDLIPALDAPDLEPGARRAALASLDGGAGDAAVARWIRAFLA